MTGAANTMTLDALAGLLRQIRPAAVADGAAGPVGCYRVMLSPIGLDGCDQAAALLDQMAQALATCAETFEAYARHHQAKPDPEKAARNAGLAAMCRAAVILHKDA